MGADLRVWCSQCGVPASVLVSDCTYGQSPNPRRVAAAPSRTSVTVEHRAGHDGFDEFFDHTGSTPGCCLMNALPRNDISADAFLAKDSQNDWPPARSCRMVDPSR